ncbi:unnamed protein product [Cladocopium goreaui]|uniref:Pentatricopeptide repeat-containing protein At1g62930, chloroplastic n=1 Tax=Cladocopium goreaui TaxID=2562237 RepID=A0A9P1CH70_9DINO|nr:unnamed protein product [Cladocopium goreaui]
MIFHCIVFYIFKNCAKHFLDDFTADISCLQWWLATILWPCILELCFNCHLKPCIFHCETGASCGLASGHMAWHNLCLVPTQHMEEDRALSQSAANDINLQLKAFSRGHVRLNVIHYGRVLHSLEKKSLWHSSLQLLSHMAQQDVLCNIVILASAMASSAGFWQRALQLVVLAEESFTKHDAGSKDHFIRGWRDHPAAVTSTLTTLAKANSPGVCVKLLEAVATMRLQRNDFHFGAAIHSCETQGLWHKALALLETMGSLEIRGNVITYTSSLSSASTAGAWSAALQLLQRMGQAGPQPNLLSWSATISSCEDTEKAGEWNVAHHLLQQMKITGFRPNAVTFSGCISACTAWGRALQLLKRMRKGLLRVDDICLNAQLDAIAPSPLRRQAVRHGGGTEVKRPFAWPLAFRTLHWMMQTAIRADVISFSCAVASCELKDQVPLWWKALGLLETMALTQVKMNILTLRGALNACEMAGDRSQWRVSIALLKGVGKDVISHNGVLYCCLQAGQLQKALVLLQTMMEERIVPDMLSYELLVHACEIAGKWKLVPSLLSSRIVRESARCSTQRNWSALQMTVTQHISARGHR